ncbi:murein L,D-transpeptidase family protein [Hymenobacter sp. BT491]|uniref:L,D-transpeptidase family protein n=1 Tax=Hymenobacter sp. BT491 TaxID=2766779 RepID=UPI0021CC50DB|nr:hypothetical protein [Hymenobacter sp. BT491]
MRYFLLALGLLATLGARSSAPSFREQQLQYPRVRAAYAAKWPELQRLLISHGIRASELEIFVRAFKIGRRLEVWGRNRGDAQLQPLRTYFIAGTSGTLGPKRCAGDGQVPEGFYSVNRFNPNSLYHLSLGLDYPNNSDMLLSGSDPGGDIFIHGSDQTIGCLPITDALIEEVYVLAVEARNAGQATIPVHIFPFELCDENLTTYQHHAHHYFWQSLQLGYQYFEKHHDLPKVLVQPTGLYAFE